MNIFHSSLQFVRRPVGENTMSSNNETSASQNPAELQLPAFLKVPNPYGFPPVVLNAGLQIDGLPIWHFPVQDDPETHMRKVQALPMRADDIMISAFMKGGTHWVSEILYMLTKGSASYSDQVKEHHMLELVDDLPSLESESSPRIFNSHCHMVHLPREIVEKKVKIVHLLRNPKDTALSWYYHLKNMGPLENFTFDNFLQGYMLDDYVSMSHQYNFLRQMAAFEKAHPDHPIMHIYYEDMKKDPVPIIKALAKYVGVKVSDQLCEEIAQACRFDNMKKVDTTRKLPVNIADKISKQAFYRKGIVGDWKNEFTAAQSKVFDDFTSTQEKKGVGYSLKGM